MQLQSQSLRTSSMMRSAKAMWVGRTKERAAATHEPATTSLHTDRDRRDETPVQRQAETPVMLSRPDVSFANRHVAEDGMSRGVEVLRRSISLTLDAIVLTIASPIFAIWFIQRAVRKRLHTKTDKT